jgi:hypothetical protein
MLKSVNSFGKLGRLSRCSTRTINGGLVTGLAMGMPDTLRAGCKGSQILTVIVGCFGWEAITIPELMGMLPSRMHKEITALRRRTSYLENRFTGVCAR